jgi:hypothetical protein
MALAVVAFVVLGLPTAAQADHEAAKQLFRAGRAAYERGDFRAAAASFEQAAQAEPHAQAWYAAGDAWASARSADRAVYAFERALELGGLPPKRVQEVERRVATLSRRLGVADIRGPTGSAVTVAHVPRAELPLRVYLQPGDHRVELIEPAYAAQSKQVQITAGKTVEVTFDYEPQEPDAAPVSEPTVAPPEPVDPPTDEPAVAPAVAGWAMVGLGAASAVVAAAVTAVALDARDEWEADRRDMDLFDRAETLRTATGITWLAAGVLTAAGSTILIVDAITNDQGAPAASLRIGPRGAALTGRW